MENSAARTKHAAASAHAIREIFFVFISVAFRYQKNGL